MTFGTTVRLFVHRSPIGSAICQNVRSLHHSILWNDVGMAQDLLLFDLCFDITVTVSADECMVSKCPERKGREINGAHRGSHFPLVLSKREKKKKKGTSLHLEIKVRALIPLHLCSSQVCGHYLGDIVRLCWKT
ncbi:hypothetical protein CEXT_308721 [Caerostris extrusa]|uniref:Uncharacterized protein n=1 Tax=Caerostris extrusa TaxID=172846 RepID=A0AAV4YDN0_CAEEX|nr:hypothetical protein CEXT_308721 [Caerostris extrusa]